MNIDGKSGLGQKLTASEIRQALKLNETASYFEDDYDTIAKNINLSIETIAQQIVSIPSPEGSRHIIKKIKPQVR